MSVSSALNPTPPSIYLTAAKSMAKLFSPKKEQLIEFQSPNNLKRLDS